MFRWIKGCRHSARFGSPPSRLLLIIEFGKFLLVGFAALNATLLEMHHSSAVGGGLAKPACGRQATAIEPTAFLNFA
ncbi:MAG: hypothetical protein P9L94_11190, partial [Candidatus Hinthialibacter antarcticus]|nr:hypothetical protein [Candidatus Hinthialibacter antarcticus]